MNLENCFVYVVGIVNKIFRVLIFAIHVLWGANIKFFANIARSDKRCRKIKR